MWCVYTGIISNIDNLYSDYPGPLPLSVHLLAEPCVTVVTVTYSVPPNSWVAGAKLRKYPENF